MMRIFLQQDQTFTDNVFAKKVKNLPSFVWFFLRPYSVYIWSFCFCAILSGLYNICNSALLKILVDTLPQPDATFDLLGYTISTLIGAGVLFVVNFEMHNLSWRLMNCINYKVQPELKNKIFSQTFDYVMRHSHNYFQNNMAGKIANNISVLAQNIELAVHDHSRHMIRGLVMLLSCFVGLYCVHPTFFHFFMGWSVLFSAGSLWASHRSIHYVDRLAETESAVAGAVVDAVSNVSNVRFFARRQFEKAHLGDYLIQMWHAFRSKEKFMIIYWSFQGISQTFMLAVMMYLLIDLHRKGQVTAGDFALILTLCTEVGFTLWWTMEQIDHFNNAMGKCRQSLRALFAPLDIVDAPDAGTLIVQKGMIEFVDVQFAYHADKPLFQNLSLKIPAGQKVGLVGYSGSGKSSFVHLILRMFDIQQGQILIDDQSIRSVFQDSLRAHIGMIPQDPVLFHRSLLENIRYGMPAATFNEVVAAAKRAHAHNFIERLNFGYETEVGERGVKLSGGQRQRIAIARAILKNAPILILDEATSALDSVTENMIQDSLWDLMEGKTSLVIAHRLSTLLRMDRILVFDQGVIVEDGTHAQLLQKNGRYKMLWDAQVGGFIGDGTADQEHVD